MKRFAILAGALTLAMLGGADAGWAQRARSDAAHRAASDQVKLVREASQVFGQVMNAPDSAIPQAILDKAEGIAVFPNVIKAAFVFGGQRGHGILSVRNRNTNTWSEPAFLTLTAGSWGAQIGGQSADIVLVITNRRGLEKLMQDQFKIGGEAEAAAGPVGRHAAAATDIALQAGILSYSRSRGLFAGVSISGASVHEDIDANQAFYGNRFHTREITLENLPKGPAPQVVALWRNTLTRYFHPEEQPAATSGRERERRQR